MSAKPSASRASKRSVVLADLYKRVGLIIVGLIPVFMVWNEPGPTRFIGLAGALLIVTQFITIVAESQAIIDAFFPPKKAFEITEHRIDKNISRFAMVIFFFGMITMAFEIRVIENTLNGTQFFWISSLGGLVVAGLVTLAIKSIRPSVYHTSSRRYSVHFGLFIGLFLLAPATTSFLNHTFSESESRVSTFEVVKKSKGGRRNRTHWLFMKTPYSDEDRFRVPRDFFGRIEVGDNINLHTSTGLLKYDVVTHFSTPDY